MEYRTERKRRRICRESQERSGRSELRSSSRKQPLFDCMQLPTLRKVAGSQQWPVTFLKFSVLAGMGECQACAIALTGSLL